MNKNTFWQWVILVVAVSASLVIVTPPLDKKDADGRILRSGKIRLGLDLQGGTSFTVKIDEEEVKTELRSQNPGLTDEEIGNKVSQVLQGSQNRALEVLRNRVDNLGIDEPIIYAGKDNTIIIQLPGIDEEKRKEAEKSIRSAAFLEFRMVHDDNFKLVDEMFKAGKTPKGYKMAVDGGERYYVKDPTFSIESVNLDEYKKELSEFNAPPGHKMMLQKDAFGQNTGYVPYFISTRRREMTGEHLSSANVEYQSLGQPVVSLSFDSEGAKEFERITDDYRPGGARNPDTDNYRLMAIILDDTLYSSPRIIQTIYGGTAQITGSFTLQEATLLANILNAGSLPAPVKIVEKRFVSPSLGTDSIKSGMKALIIGSTAVMIFMMVYYMVCGVVANIALLLDMVLFPLGMIIAAGSLGVFGSDGGASSGIKLPVLTLPGIAGITLTIGMAVDANILIFERIREELTSGKRIWTSITAGYDRAFVTIMDANITTLLTGIILFIFGSGPIRGFAVTLCAGIIVSVFTALVATKLIFGVLVEYAGLEKIRMLSLVREAKIDFVSLRKPAAILSLVIIIVGMGYIVSKGRGEVLGVDFTGGSSLVYERDLEKDKVAIEDVRRVLKDAGLAEIYIQYQGDMEEALVDKYLEVKMGTFLPDGITKQADVAKKVIGDNFGESRLSLQQEDEVGPQVGDALRKSALLAIIFAILGIIVYLWFRFELGFAFGAVVALLHDVLVTIGIYVMLGQRISLPIVAALLTIVGYSVNDTIVVFDRIREDLRLVRNKSFKEICNLSINQTLSRTLLTSFTTLITVVMLLIFGGGAIYDFALALFIGIIVGTYSSIFVATPVVLLWHRDKKPEFATK